MSKKGSEAVKLPCHSYKSHYDNSALKYYCYFLIVMDSFSELQISMI